jgi:hypothetical protein
MGTFTPTRSISRRALRAVFAGLLLPMLLLGTALAADSPSIRHTVFMRGHVLEVGPDSLVLCIGRADGAEVGQELSVVRHRPVTAAPKRAGRFERQPVGKVRVTAIIDEHYAEAAIIEGEVRMHDTVELASRRQ